MPNPTSLQTAVANKTLLKLDGSMSTPLEALGADLNHPLWTAKVIKEKPELIEKVHYDYFKAGANITITASYQGALQGFLDNGYTEADAIKAISDTVRLAAKAREKVQSEGVTEPLWIAGSVGLTVRTLRTVPNTAVITICRRQTTSSSTKRASKLY